MILVGDLNVAPLPSDVWSHKALLNVVSHTPIEVEHMEEMRASHDWIDVARRFVPDPEPLFTWWSYRSPNWEKADKGRRLDHIWVTPALAADLVACRTVKPARAWQKPSDHAPVVAEIALPMR
jgi:exodeoxyribonuclease-3